MMKKVLWILVGMVAGCVLAHQINQTTRGKQFCDEFAERSRAFRDSVIDSYREREAELRAAVADTEKER